MEKDSCSGPRCIDRPVFAIEIHVLRAHHNKMNMLNMKLKGRIGGS